jgi:hypothetical protein
LNVKPTVGFTLPWAGLSPALSIKTKMGPDGLLEGARARGSKVSHRGTHLRHLQND